MTATTMDRFKLIAEMASTYGVTLRLLRVWEKYGVLKPLRQGRTRYYSAREEAIFRLARRVNVLGLPLPEVGRRIDRDEVSVTLTLDDLGRLHAKHQRDYAEALRAMNLCGRLMRQADPTTATITLREEVG
jgi:DNA-binding transcriptional MerR regulator